MVVAGSTAPLLVVGSCVTTEVMTAAVCETVVGVTAGAIVVGTDDVEGCGGGGEEVDTDDEVDEVETVTGCTVLVEGGIEVDEKKVEICVTMAVEAAAGAATS